MLDEQPPVSPPPSPRRRKVPLSFQVMIGAALGVVLGLSFGSQPYLGPDSGSTFGNASLGQIGTMVIRLLKALAAPLILFAIVDAFVRVQFTWRQGVRLLSSCALNAAVACTIGLGLMNVFRPGELWRPHVQEMLAQLPVHEVKSDGVTLDPLQNLSSYIPDSFVEPFLQNKVISIVLAGLLVGMALRRLQRQTPEDLGVRTMVALANTAFRLLVQLLDWVVHLAPFAVLGTTADAVGRNGLSVFGLLAPFVGILLTGMALHALVYCPLVAWLIGKRKPRVYLAGVSDAVFTGISCNSSLATVPVTLKCLTEKLGVSDASARLSACVGTNLNNDGITMYVAMSAVFLAQALGNDLGLGAQLTVVASAVMAGAGIAGVPEAGLIVLPLVLGSAGVPSHFVNSAVNLVWPVDWIIARARTGVNVMSDCTVAAMLDGAAAHDQDPTLQPA